MGRGDRAASQALQHEEGRTHETFSYRGHGRKPDRLRRQWKEFQAVVVDHEVGHLEIYRRILDELPQAMSEIGAVPCDELDSRIAAAADRVVDSIQLASSDYDAHVGAGKFTPHQL